MGKTGRLLLTFGVATWLGGCAAADTALHHRDLQIQTHMSETIFLAPVAPALKTVYLGARNTSDYPKIDLKAPLALARAARGYRVVDDPEKAHYMLRVNLLQAGPIDNKTKTESLLSKYGEPVLVGGGGAVLSRVLGGDVATTVAIGLGLAATDYLANQLVEDVTYSVTADVQLSERPVNPVRSTHDEHARHADHPAADIPPVDDNGFKQYRTRALVYAEQMNLKFDDAVPLLVNRLTSSLSNLLE